MTRPLIAVFGATGTVGGGLVRALLTADEREFRARAVTRRPGSAAAHALYDLGAEICAADLDDAASVERAMAGAHGAFCITSAREHGSPEREFAQADTLAAAAQRCCVRHVVWSTLEDTRTYVAPDGLTMPVLQQHYNVPCLDAKGAADQCFIGRGLPLTRLLLSLTWERLVSLGLWPQPAGDGPRAFVLPIGDTRLPGIAAADIGACAAALFRQREAALGRRVGIAGEQLSGAQMATALARALGEPVRYLPVTPAAYAALGFPGADEIANLCQFVRDFNAEFCAPREVATTRALHPAALTFAAWLAAHAAQRPIATRAVA